MIEIIKNLMRMLRMRRKKTVVEMEDGTIYVANSPNSGRPMYAMPYDLEGQYTWDDAKTAAAGQSFAGHADWRLPTKEELNVLYRVHRAQKSIGLLDLWYWSATEYSISYAWFQLFENGHRNVFFKTSTFSVRCVRTG